MNTSVRKRRALRRWVDGVCVLLWAGAILALATVAVGGVARLRAQRPVPRVREVAIPHGGTLWDLAVQCRAAGQDPRAVAAEIRALNRLRPGRTLHPGARLLVPDYGAGAARLAQNLQPPAQP